MKHKLFFSLLFILMIVLAGCSDEKGVATKQAESVKVVAAKVKEVKVNEAPPEASSPAEAALSQYEVIMDNGESKFPAEESLITETIFGRNGVVALHSPEGADQFAIFLYGFDKQWFVEGVIRLKYLEEEAYTGKAGLALPMDSFNTANIEIGEEKEIWAFADKEKLVTIGRYDRFDFQAVESELVSLNNGIEAYVTEDQFNNPNLYYFDSEKLITVSGNLNLEELIEIANSLPSAHSTSFPGSVQ